LKGLANQRSVLDQIKVRLGVTNQEDWYAVTFKMFKTAGGGGILDKYGTLFKGKTNSHLLTRLALRTIYPEYKWDISNFKHHEHRMTPTYPL
jgi:hypothetical protein